MPYCTFERCVLASCLLLPTDQYQYGLFNLQHASYDPSPSAPHPSVLSRNHCVRSVRTVQRTSSTLKSHSNNIALHLDPFHATMQERHLCAVVPLAIYIWSTMIDLRVKNGVGPLLYIYDASCVEISPHQLFLPCRPCNACNCMHERASSQPAQPSPDLIGSCLCNLTRDK